MAIGLYQTAKAQALEPIYPKETSMSKFNNLYEQLEEEIKKSVSIYMYGGAPNIALASYGIMQQLGDII